VQKNKVKPRQTTTNEERETILTASVDGGHLHSSTRLNSWPGIYGIYSTYTYGRYVCLWNLCPGIINFKNDLINSCRVRRLILFTYNIGLGSAISGISDLEVEHSWVHLEPHRYYQTDQLGPTVAGEPEELSNGSHYRFLLWAVRCPHSAEW